MYLTWGNEVLFPATLLLWEVRKRLADDVTGVLQAAYVPCATEQQTA